MYMNDKLYVCTQAKDGLWRNNLFYGCGVAAVVVCIGTAELYALALGLELKKTE
jgi:hypothetical protein